jgi:hypothetical protein
MSDSNRIFAVMLLALAAQEGVASARSAMIDVQERATDSVGRVGMTGRAEMALGFAAVAFGEEAQARGYLESETAARYVRDAGLVLEEYGALLFAATGRTVEDTLEYAARTFKEDVGPNQSLFMGL